MSYQIKNSIIFSICMVFACFDTSLQAAKGPKGQDKRVTTKHMSTQTLKSLEEQLFAASEQGDVEEVQKLLDAGADVNFSPDNDHFTSLHNAARKGHDKVIEALLKAGANPNEVTDAKKFTPLHLAAMNGYKDAVKALLKAEANPNLLNVEDSSPLLLFALSIDSHRQSDRFKSLEIAQDLLAAGADIKKENIMYDSPLKIFNEIAARPEHPIKNILKLLLEEQLEDSMRQAINNAFLKNLKVINDIYQNKEPRSLQTLNEIMDNEAECPICLDKVDVENCVITPCCRKALHSNCIKDLFKSNPNAACPMCRNQIDFKNIQNL